MRLHQAGKTCSHVHEFHTSTQMTNLPVPYLPELLFGFSESRLLTAVVRVSELCCRYSPRLDVPGAALQVDTSDQGSQRAHRIEGIIMCCRQSNTLNIVPHLKLWQLG